MLHVIRRLDCLLTIDRDISRYFNAFIFHNRMVRYLSGNVMHCGADPVVVTSAQCWQKARHLFEVSVILMIPCHVRGWGSVIQNGSTFCLHVIMVKHTYSPKMIVPGNSYNEDLLFSRPIMHSNVWFKWPWPRHFPSFPLSNYMQLSAFTSTAHKIFP